MTKKLYNCALICFLSYAGAMMFNSVYLGENEPSRKMEMLVDESTKKNAIAESNLLSENPLVPTDVPKALSYIKKHPDYTSYHLLLAVRKYYSASYKEVSDGDIAAILCSALKHSRHLNDWGYLTPSESFDGPSAKALLELGNVALKLLLPILDDSGGAPLFGSQEATASRAFNYRRKDFAYRYASLIHGQAPAFSADPKDRDKDIEMLKINLKKRSH